MQTEVKEISINGTVYVPKNSAQEKAESFDGMEYVIVRTYSAGVFAGYLAKREGQEVLMRHARRLWYWSGAATLSQLAMEGTKKPSECKFPMPVDSIVLTEAIEIIPVTKEAKKSLDGVGVWRQ